MALHISLILSVISFVSVSVVIVLYAVNSSRIKNLSIQSSEQASEMINHSVIQDTKISEVVHSVNNNDEIIQRNNSMLQTHVENVEKDIKTKQLNIDDMLRETSENMDQRLEGLRSDAESSYINLDDRINEARQAQRDLDLKYELRTNSNVNLINTLTHANQDLIHATNSNLGLLEISMNNNFERVENTMGDNHSELFEKIVTGDARIRTDFVNADDILRNSMLTQISTTRDELSTDFNNRLSDYVMTSTLDNYKGMIDQFFTTKLETASNSSRILDFERMNIEQRFTDVHDDMHTLDNKFTSNYNSVMDDYNVISNDFNDFKQYEYTGFSNYVVNQQQRNFEDLNRTFGIALSNLDQLVDIRQDGFETHFATKAYTLSNFYSRDTIDTILESNKEIISSELMDHIHGNLSDFQGVTGATGATGVGIQSIGKSYSDTEKSDMIDFTLTDGAQHSISVPAGRHGASFSNMRIEDGHIKYDVHNYNVNNIVETPEVKILGNAPSNGADGTGISNIITRIYTDSTDGLEKTEVKISMTNGSSEYLFNIPHGMNGQDGQDGVSITGVVQLSPDEILSESLVSTHMHYNIVLSNGTTHRISIPKGEKGDTGEAGATGPGINLFDESQDYRLTLTDRNGICLQKGNVRKDNLCISEDDLRAKFYTKWEYSPDYYTLPRSL